MAALNELSQCVCLLIEDGADCSMKTKSDVTAFSLLSEKTPTAIEAIKDKLTDYITLSYQSDALSEIEVTFDFKNGLKHPKEYSILNAFIDAGHKELLLHPFIMAFLYVTWHRTRRCYYGMIYNSFIFGVIILCYVLTALAYDCDKKINNPLFANTTVHCNNTSHFYTLLRKNPLTLEIQWYILFYFTMSLIYRKIYGFRGYPSLKHYIFNWGNAFDWWNIIYVFLISFVYTQSVESWQVYVGACAVVCAWSNLIFLIGQLPVFGPYVEMFQKVQTEFQKLLAVFCPFLIGYVASFCILFPNSPAFYNPVIGLISVLVMMTGDMNYNLLLEYSETEDSASYAMYSAQLIYTFFLIYITIILMNLLVGMVVNDIQGLQKNADLSRLQRQTKMCSYIEKSHHHRSALSKNIMILLRVFPKPYIPVLKVKLLDQDENESLKGITQAAYDLAKKKYIRKKDVINRRSTEPSPLRRLTNGSFKHNHIDDFRWTTCLGQLMYKLKNQTHEINNLHQQINELKMVIKSGFRMSLIGEETHFNIDCEKRRHDVSYEQGRSPDTLRKCSLA